MPIASALSFPIVGSHVSESRRGIRLSPGHSLFLVQYSVSLCLCLLLSQTGLNAAKKRRLRERKAVSMEVER